MQVQLCGIFGAGAAVWGLGRCAGVLGAGAGLGADRGAVRGFRSRCSWVGF